MKSWSIVVDVPDQTSARELADTLSDYGVTQVTGWPADSCWSVMARVFGDDLPATRSC